MLTTGVACPSVASFLSFRDATLDDEEKVEDADDDFLKNPKIPPFFSPSSLSQASRLAYE